MHTGVEESRSLWRKTLALSRPRWNKEAPAKVCTAPWKMAVTWRIPSLLFAFATCLAFSHSPIHFDFSPAFLPSPSGHALLAMHFPKTALVPAYGNSFRVASFLFFPLALVAPRGFALRVNLRHKHPSLSPLMPSSTSTPYNLCAYICTLATVGVIHISR